jgi:hypothetical protein
VQSGGTLHIRSIPGEGTTVTLLLPQIAAGRSEVHAGDPAGAPPDPVSPARVLLVEDNEQVAEIVRMLLAEQGHVVLQASDAVSAMAIHRAVREALLASRSRPRRLPGNTMVV